MAININSYGSIISDDATGNKILSDVKSALQKKESVVVDFSGVFGITTFNAKQIFGELYSDLGPDNFFKKIVIRNASDNIVTIIKLGIKDKMSNLSISH